jgi:hypothetical protein
MISILAGLCISTSARAEISDKSDLRANFRRIAVEMSSVEVKNAEYYTNSPNSKLSADSKTEIKGVFDFILEYEQPKWQWNNSLYSKYGRTEIKPVGGPNKKTEDDDQILLSTDYSCKMWHLDFDDAVMGPFVKLGYGTEFTKNRGAPKEKVFSGKTGIKIFNGLLFKELYMAAVGEYDLTYANNKTTKGAYELGFKAEKPLYEGVKFQFEGYYRDYISYSGYQATDLKYEFSLVGRMDVKIKDNFSLAPYVEYFQGESRSSQKTGSNFMIGFSVAYAKLILL